MKRLVLLLFPAIFCLSLTVISARSQSVVGLNARPAPTPLRAPTPPKQATARAESELTGETDDDVIKVATELVTIPVKVLDRQGRFVGGLKKEDFNVFADQQRQEIAHFSNEQVPFTVALVLDMSYSAKFRAEEIQRAALAFVNQLRPNDKVMVVSFDEVIYVNCEPTSDRRVLREAIRRTKISYGTSLYDAMHVVINEKLRRIEGRKAIVLFSDGVDTTSQRALETDNLDDTLELDALIYPIRYDTFLEVQAMKNRALKKVPATLEYASDNPAVVVTETRAAGTTDPKGTSVAEYLKGDEYLRELAARTGGRVYQASTLPNLATAFRSIASELREYYSLSFYPQETGEPGQKRRLKVRVQRPNLAVQSRDSYSVKQ